PPGVRGIETAFHCIARSLAHACVAPVPSALDRGPSRRGLGGVGVGGGGRTRAGWGGGGRGARRAGRGRTFCATWRGMWPGKTSRNPLSVLAARGVRVELSAAIFFRERILSGGQSGHLGQPRVSGQQPRTRSTLQPRTKPQARTTSLLGPPWVAADAAGIGE